MTHYEKLDILTSNQKEFRGRGDIANEQRSLTLSEIARTLCEDNEGEALSEIVRKNAELTAECSPADSIILCRELLMRKRSADELKRITAIGEGEETAAGTHGKIAYPKNKFNDAAFEYLSLAVSTPRAVYTSSINAACEAVAEGSCEFCILPIENSLDGKLFGFYSLLDRYAPFAILMETATLISDMRSLAEAAASLSSASQKARRLFWNFSCLIRTATFLTVCYLRQRHATLSLSL